MGSFLWLPQLLELKYYSMIIVRIICKCGNSRQHSEYIQLSLCSYSATTTICSTTTTTVGSCDSYYHKLSQDITVPGSVAMSRLTDWLSSLLPLSYFITNGFNNTCWAFLSSWPLTDCSYSDASFQVFHLYI